MLFISISTVLLITLIIFSVMNFSFGIIFYTMILGQITLIVGVYKVLTDDYTTHKTFDDFYEDRPDLGEKKS